MEFRTLLAVAFTLTFTYAGLGRALPFETGGFALLAAGVTLFAAYLYLARTLVRLPLAIVIMIRRTRYARRHYGLNGRESLRDGFARGFLDMRRWTVGSLALIDRLALVGFTLAATTPSIGRALVLLGGFGGLALLLILYLVRGTFSGLVDDGAGRGWLL